MHVLNALPKLSPISLCLLGARGAAVSRLKGARGFITASESTWLWSLHVTRLVYPTRICRRFILLFIKWDVPFRTPEERRDVQFRSFSSMKAHITNELAQSHCVSDCTSWHAEGMANWWRIWTVLASTVTYLSTEVWREKQLLTLTFHYCNICSWQKKRWIYFQGFQSFQPNIFRMC